MVKTEVFRLQGGQIITIAGDNQVMPARGGASQKQAFYVLDDKKRVFYVSADEKTQFTSNIVGNLPNHTEMYSFEYDWSVCFMSHTAVMRGDYIVSL